MKTQGQKGNYRSLDASVLSDASPTPAAGAVAQWLDDGLAHVAFKGRAVFYDGDETQMNEQRWRRELRRPTVMSRAVELWLATLAAPRPPSSFDAFTADEPMVQLFEGYSEILDRGDLPAAELQEVRNWRQTIIDDITLTIELRTGRRAYPVLLCSYADSIAEAAERWAAAGRQSVYVPTLNHGDTGAGEYDGFDGLGPLVPDLMERRTVLWGSPVVRQLLAPHRGTEAIGHLR